MLGIPGSGKRMTAKGEQVYIMLKKNIIQNLNENLIRPGDDVIVIDPEAEYVHLIEAFGGEVVKISAESSDYINPFDITDAYSDDEAGRQNPIAMKSEFILSLCELIISRNTSRIESKEVSILDRVIGLTYRPYFTAKPTSRQMPTFKDFFKILKEQPEPEAKQLALSLELYIEGSLSLFSHRTTIDTTSQFIDFDISGLGGQLQPLAMLVVLDQIWNRVTLNRELGKRTWIYIDEIYLLFQNEYSSLFLKSLFKRARKWGAVMTGITQNVEELLLSEDARSMLSNSEFICMLSQSKNDREQLAELLNLSPEQISYVTNAQPGQGIIYCSGAVVPFINRYPENTELYKLMTTKIDDINAYRIAMQESVTVL
jgi:type IV secretory pathway VirB4 component